MLYFVRLHMCKHSFPNTLMHITSNIGVQGTYNWIYTFKLYFPSFMCRFVFDERCERPCEE